MKTFHALLFVAFLGVSHAVILKEEYLTANDRECLTEVGIDLQTVLNGVDDNYLGVEGDTKMNAYYECCYRKLDAIDENNDIKFDVLHSLMASYIEALHKDVVDKEQVASDAIEACKGVENNNLGDYLVKLNNCVFKKTQHI